MSHADLTVLILLFVACQRLAELWLARRNARWALRRGAIETGAAHYPLFVLLHAGFLLSLGLEIALKRGTTSLSIPFLIIFALAQALRIWCIATLGRYWNVRIFVIPGSSSVATGPYRFLRHPNYLAVTLELVSLPLVFHAYVTATLFSVLNYGLLRHRIAVEERALAATCDYDDRMSRRLRGFFWGRAH
ncbi:MAG: isoprenylcysteine carboxyl methyltransferase [Firmicutes bacterium]|nr:isoprenylcysteine carboxyl methyltransferase [Bacillota bacterium]